MTPKQIDGLVDLLIHEVEAIESLRHRGYAVVVLSPQDLGSLPPAAVERALVHVLGFEGTQELAQTISQGDQR